MVPYCEVHVLLSTFRTVGRSTKVSEIYLKLSRTNRHFECAHGACFVELPRCQLNQVDFGSNDFTTATESELANAAKVWIICLLSRFYLQLTNNAIG